MRYIDSVWSAPHKIGPPPLLLRHRTKTSRMNKTQDQVHVITSVERRRK